MIVVWDLLGIAITPCRRTRCQKVALKEDEEILDALQTYNEDKTTYSDIKAVGSSCGTIRFRCYDYCFVI